MDPQTYRSYRDLPPLAVVESEQSLRPWSRPAQTVVRAEQSHSVKARNSRCLPHTSFRRWEVAIERRVRKTGKDKDGDITSLCNTPESWSPRMKAGAISDIEGGSIKYYVEEETPRSWVKVVDRGGRKHLQTTSDAHSKNNLDNLDNC